MFDFDQPLLLAGLLLGLSSSLHCFGMCAGIAASLHFAADLDPSRPARELFPTTLLINAGRIAGYVIAGTIVGGVGSSIFGSFDHHPCPCHSSLGRRGGTGLDRAFNARGPASPARALSGCFKRQPFDGRRRRSGPAAGAIALFLSGAVWGFLPCAMVYAALFYAMLSGSLARRSACDVRLWAWHVAGPDRRGPRTSAAPAQSHLGMAEEYSRAGHHHGRHHQRGHIAGDVCGMVPLRLIRNQQSTIEPTAVIAAQFRLAALPSTQTRKSVHNYHIQPLDVSSR